MPDSLIIIVVSSVRPEPSSGGQILLHRHLVARPGIKLEVYGAEPDKLTFTVLLRRIVARACGTRLRRTAEDCWALWNGRWLDAILPRLVRGNRTIVLTVAHGDACMAALRFSRKQKLPLITFFHDWWPDIPDVHGPIRQVLRSRFNTLYRSSEVALCVSEGMKAALGPHTSAPVLYPIATPVQNNIMEVQSSEDGDLGTFTVLYFGNLFEYGPMLAAALGALIDHATIRLEVRGRNPNWPANFLQLVRNRGLWRDFAPRAELDRWLTKADAYLIPMTFETRLRRRMETCFPSKLSELSQFGKPLVIWGPEYCSAIRWAQQNRSALCVPNENPAALVAALENLARSGSERIRLSKLSKQAAQREFDPENLQSQFHAALARALDNHYSKFSSRTHCGSAYLPSTTRRV